MHAFALRGTGAHWWPPAEQHQGSGASARANAAANMERYHEAVDDLGRALDRDPRRTDALVLRAAAWRHLGHLDLAQDDVERALAADPEDPEALLERGAADVME